MEHIQEDLAEEVVVLQVMLVQHAKDTLVVMVVQVLMVMVVAVQVL